MITRNGEPISAEQLRHRVRTDLDFDAPLNGLVPPYEEHEAAAASGVPWDRWRALAWWDRARVILWHRYHRLVEASVQDAAYTQAEREGRRRSAR